MLEFFEFVKKFPNFACMNFEFFGLLIEFFDFENKIFGKILGDEKLEQWNEKTIGMICIAVLWPELCLNPQKLGLENWGWLDMTVDSGELDRLGWKSHWLKENDLNLGGGRSSLMVGIQSSVTGHPVGTHMINPSATFKMPTRGS